MVSGNDKKLVEEWNAFLFSDFKATKRALWLARAERAYMMTKWLTLEFRISNDRKYNEAAKVYESYLDKWKRVERKCCEKAEQYI